MVRPRVRLLLASLDTAHPIKKAEVLDIASYLVAARTRNARDHHGDEPHDHHHVGRSHHGVGLGHVHGPASFGAAFAAASRSILASSFWK